jgi:hypothetical protein
VAEGAEEKRKLTEISSFIADLPTAVQKFWNAVAGPLFEFSIALVVVFFAMGGDQKIGGAVSSMQLAANPPVPLNDPYGIKILIPVAVLIFLIGIAQGASKLLRVIGAAIPGKLVPDRTFLLARYAPAFEIVEAWQYNPRLKRLDELNAEIDTTIGRSTPDPFRDILSKIRAMEGRSDGLASTASFVKGLLAVTIIISVLLNVFEAWPMHWSRLAVVFAGSCVVLIYLAFGRVQAEREYAGRKVGDYNLQKKMSAQSPPATSEGSIEPAAIYEQLRRANLESPWALNFIPFEAGHDLFVLGASLIRIGRD